MAKIEEYEVSYKTVKTEKKGRPKTIICLDNKEYPELGFDKKLNVWYWKDPITKKTKRKSGKKHRKGGQ